MQAQNSICESSDFPLYQAGWTHGGVLRYNLWWELGTKYHPPGGGVD